MMAARAQDCSDETGIHTLTGRELEVLRLACDGWSSKQLADILCCSKRTVDFHLHRIYRKLGVSNRIAAIRQSGVLPA